MIYLTQYIVFFYVDNFVDKHSQVIHISTFFKKFYKFEYNKYFY